MAIGQSCNVRQASFVLMVRTESFSENALTITSGDILAVQLKLMNLLRIRTAEELDEMFYAVVSELYPPEEES